MTVVILLPLRIRVYPLCRVVAQVQVLLAQGQDHVPRVVVRPIPSLAGFDLGQDWPRAHRCGIRSLNWVQ